MELVLYVFITGFCSGLATVILGLSFVIQHANRRATGSAGGVGIARMIAVLFLFIAAFSALQAYLMWGSCVC